MYPSLTKGLLWSDKKTAPGGQPAPVVNLKKVKIAETMI